MTPRWWCRCPIRDVGRTAIRRKRLIAAASPLFSCRACGRWVALLWGPWEMKAFPTTGGGHDFQTISLGQQIHPRGDKLALGARTEDMPRHLQRRLEVEAGGGGPWPISHHCRLRALRQSAEAAGACRWRYFRGKPAASISSAGWPAWASPGFARRPRLAACRSTPGGTRSAAGWPWSTARRARSSPRSFSVPAWTRSSTCGCCRAIEIRRFPGRIPISTTRRRSGSCPAELQGRHRRILDGQARQ